MAEYIEREDLMAENAYKNVEKIKTTFAKIIVDGTAEKPYYSILWLDEENKEYNVGYSSYCLDYVFEWMEEVFEIVAADEQQTAYVTTVLHGRWIVLDDCANEGLYCSECKKRIYKKVPKVMPNFCSNCGSDMRNVNDNPEMLEEYRWEMTR